MMFIYRDEYYDTETPSSQGEAEIIIAKHRNGAARRRHADVPAASSRSFMNYARRATGGDRERRGPARCEFGVCDGSGLVVDEDDEPARAVPLPRPIVGERARPRARHGDPASATAACRSTAPPVTEMRPARRRRSVRALRAQHRRSTSTQGRGPVALSATSAPARRRSRCSSRRPRSRPAARSRSTRCRGCSPRSATPTTTARAQSYTELLDRLAEVDLLHLDDLGAEKHDRLGARAALLDRQRALRGRALDRRHDQPRPRASCAEQIGARTVSRLDEMCERAAAVRRATMRTRRRAATCATRLSGSRCLDSSAHARNRDRRRPVGRRGQGQGHRPARRAGRRGRSASRAATTPATRSCATARSSSST